jgi:hypothetical protein
MDAFAEMVKAAMFGIRALISLGLSPFLSFPVTHRS